MKNLRISTLRLFVFILFFVFGTYAVAQKKNAKTSTKSKTPQSTKVTETKTTEKTETKTETKSEEPKASILKNHSKEIQKIIKKDDGIIRGYDFGISKQKIKETEDAEYVADGKDFVIYNVNIDDKEKAEIIYYLDEKDMVKGFGIAFLVDANTLATNVESTLIDDFQKYFTERYGKNTVNDKNDEVWTAKDGSYSVEMGDSSEDASMVEIEIEIFKKK